MRNEDLQLISTLGQALYANPAQAESRSIETVAAISTLDALSEDQFLERALGLLLHQAQRDGLRSGAAGVASPFYRLGPKERFVLFLLHSGRLSYKRLSALLSITPEELQSMAWGARTQIASSPEVRSRAPHPSGSSHLRQNCPEFDLTRPWSQKLLDDEMGSRELSFLQNHVSICHECRRALNQTRELYYAVEKTIPLETNRERAAAIGTHMKKALRRSRLRAGALPEDLTFLEALTIFLSRRENAVWAFLLVAALFALAWAKRRTAG